jgi:hypothetical protein
MGDVFRFKKGDRVRCGTEEAEVIAVVPKENSYRVKILSTEREMRIEARLVKPLEEDEEDAFGSER